MATHRIVIALALLAVASGCGSSTSEPAGPAATSAPAAAASSSSTAAQADPYEVYLTLPGADPGISREDAQTRALLGCGLAWAPGTVDAALQQAYVALVEQARAQGHCG